MFTRPILHTKFFYVFAPRNPSSEVQPNRFGARSELEGYATEPSKSSEGAKSSMARAIPN